MTPGTLYVIAAPSGAGKTSLVEALVSSIDRIEVSVSFTTRPARPHEKDGYHYHFITTGEFDKKREEGLFLEAAEVYGHFYATSKKWVEETLAAGRDVILEIDWQGAKQVRQHFPHCVGIYILPLSLETLRLRLEIRASDKTQIIESRMEKAKEEMSHYKDFDYLVMNEEFDLALMDLQSIVRSNRLSIEKQREQHEAIINELLA